MTLPLYPNGEIPLEALDRVPSADGWAYLLPIPAASFNRIVAEVERRYGWSPRVTSAGDGFRSKLRQVNVFRQRYRRAYAVINGRVDQRWWDDDGDGIKTAYYRWTGYAAAVPGTSNHGYGITVDVTGLGYFGSTRWNQFASVAVAEGWSNAEGRSVGEPWHWNYTRSAYEVVNTNELPDVSITPVPEGDLPDALDKIVQEDDMYLFVKDLYKRYLGRTGSTTEYADWVDAFRKENIVSLIDAEKRFLQVRAERGTVVAAYKEILGRAPENQEVVTHWSDTETIKQVWDGIADSREARLRRGEKV